MAQESWKREEEAGCQPAEGPILCTNNCGFFGSVATMNLCSKCYRELTVKQSSKAAAAVNMSSIKGLHQLSPPPPPPPPSSSSMELKKQLQHEQEEESVAAAVVSPLLDAGISSSSSTPSKPAVVSVAETSAPATKSLTNRCFSCRKRVGLTGFKCRCGDTFCSLHRYSDKHNCTYDYKAAARTAIAKANPVVKADKMEKI